MLPAVANIGTNPTFDGTTVKIEVHLLDFDQDLYGQWMEFAPPLPDPAGDEIPLRGRLEGANRRRHRGNPPAPGLRFPDRFSATNTYNLAFSARKRAHDGKGNGARVLVFRRGEIY